MFAGAMELAACGLNENPTVAVAASSAHAEAESVKTGQRSERAAGYSKSWHDARAYVCVSRYAGLPKHKDMSCESRMHVFKHRHVARLSSRHYLDMSLHMWSVSELGMHTPFETKLE